MSYISVWKLRSSGNSPLKVETLQLKVCCTHTDQNIPVQCHILQCQVSPGHTVLHTYALFSFTWNKPVFSFMCTVIFEGDCSYKQFIN